jgi:hypothetical protein
MPEALAGSYLNLPDNIMMGDGTVDPKDTVLIPPHFNRLPPVSVPLGLQIPNAFSIR